MVVAVVAYPFAVYFGIRVLPPSFFGLMLALLLALRLGVIRADERALIMPLLLPFLVYALLAAVLGSERLLLYYPVLVNATLFVLFTLSVYRGSPILLRVARARGMEMTAHAVPYLRRLTLVWAGFFALNGVVSAWTTTQPLGTWAVYNGLITYALIGLLVAGELLFRIHYKKRMAAGSD